MDLTLFIFLCLQLMILSVDCKPKNETIVSPINFVLSELTHQKAPKLVFSPDYSTPKDCTLINRAFIFQVTCLLGDAATLSGGVLKTTYTFIAPADNPGLKPIVDAIPRAPYENDTVNISNFVLTDLVDMTFKQYVTYKGATTAPPHTDTIRWIFSLKFLEFSEKQIQVFRNAGKFEPDMIRYDRILRLTDGRPVSLVKNC